MFQHSNPDVRAVIFQERNNLKNRNSKRYNGLIHKKTVGVEAATDGKGVVLVTKNKKGKYKVWLICNYHYCICPHVSHSHL